MTVIAIRNGIIAADSQHTIGYAKHYRARKIARAPDGTLVGVAGNHGLSTALLEWCRRGADPDQMPMPTSAGNHESSFTAIIRRPGGKVMFLDHGGMSPILDDYFAMGAGAEVALGAMFAGAEAPEAVQAAIKHSTGCGGRVQTLRMYL